MVDAMADRTIPGRSAVGERRHALAIVETPLQLLCAFEAIGGDVSSRIVLRRTGVGNNDEQCAELAQRLDMRCLVVDAPVRSPLAMILALLSMRRLILRRHGAVYLGSYYSRFIRMVGRFLRGEKFFLDDGTTTITLQEEMQGRSSPPSLFTFFRVDALPGQRCERHSFSRVREIFSIKGSKGAYFIGQPFVELGLMDAEDYVRIVSAAKAMAGQYLLYVPHRVEAEEHLSALSDALGIDLFRPRMSIEMDFLAGGLGPESIFSCYSTALFTLSALFPDARCVALLPSSLSREKQSAELRSIVDAMRSTGRIDVVPC